MILFLLLTFSGVLIISSIAWLFWVRRFYFVEHRIPGPTALPIIGNILDAAYVKFDMISIINMQPNFGGAMRLLFGTVPTVFVRDAEFLQIYATYRKHFDRTRPAKITEQYIGRGSLIVAGGDDWKKTRTLVSNAFYPMSPPFLYEQMKGRNECLLKSLIPYINKGWFQVTRPIRLCNTVLLTSLLIAEPFDDESFINDFDDVEEITAICTKRQISPLHFFNATFRWTNDGKRFFRSRDEARSIGRRILEKARQERTDFIAAGKSIPNRFVHNILENNSDESDERLIAHILTMYLAGVDTTTYGLTFALMMLGMHQDIQEKLFEEIILVESQLQGKTKEYTDLSRYDYLGRILKETLRIFPIVPITSNTFNEEISMGKYILPEGTTLIANFFQAHRNEKYFPKPLVFDPDRFLPENIGKNHPYSYMPFGAGKRTCIGAKYAQMSIKTALIPIVHNYKVFTEYKTMEEVEKNLRGSITLKDLNGGRIKLESRSKN